MFAQSREQVIAKKTKLFGQEDHDHDFFTKTKLIVLNVLPNV
jgi:hypothetical protein